MTSNSEVREERDQVDKGDEEKALQIPERVHGAEALGLDGGLNSLQEHGGLGVV